MANKIWIPLRGRLLLKLHNACVSIKAILRLCATGFFFLPELQGPGWDNCVFQSALNTHRLVDLQSAKLFPKSCRIRIYVSAENCQVIKMFYLTTKLHIDLYKGHASVQPSFPKLTPSNELWLFIFCNSFVLMMRLGSGIWLLWWLCETDVIISLSTTRRVLRQWRQR